MVQPGDWMFFGNTGACGRTTFCVEPVRAGWPAAATHSSGMTRLASRPDDASRSGFRRQYNNWQKGA